MFRKFVFIILLLFFNLQGLCAETLKINSINFDISDSFMYLSTSGVNNSTYKINLKGIKLSNPVRIYFDIENAILTQPNNSWAIKNSHIKSVKISQFSTNPYVVRLVIYPNENYNLSNMNVVSLNNNILFRFSPTIIKNNFLTQIYSDTTQENIFLENTIFIQDDEQIKTPALKSVETFNEVQKSFNEPIKSSDVINTKPQTMPTQVKFKSKYFVDKINIKSGNILVLGSGIMKFEKPFYLTNPSRVVFDMPDSMVTQNLRNREFKLDDETTLKIGQFENSKARFVITSKNAQKYKIVYSFDLQSFLIANEDNLIGVKLFDKTTDLVSQNAKSTDSLTDILTLNFSAPVIHSMKKESNWVEINIYNIGNYNLEAFRNALKQTNFYGTRIEKMPYNNGIKLIIQAQKGTNVDYYSTLDGKNLVLKLKREKTKLFSSSISKKTVLIDAGHGGNDTGAIRSSIEEKDINLDIAKRVADILTTKGATVVMTRNNDINPSLEDRVECGIKNHANIFVSIHTNASVKTEISGLETHYYHDNSYNLANIIHKNLCKNINTQDRGLFKSKFYVINHSKVPAVLVEIGYISNDNERNQILTEKRKQLTAEAIAKGIMEFFAKTK